MSFFRILTLGTLATVISATLLNAQGQEQKAFFLPKSPVAAAYVLGRLSDKELIQAPRSEYVFVALLQRKGLERKYRIEALDGLATLRKTDSLTELIAGLGELDKKGESTEAVIRDLSPILLQTKPESLMPKRGALEKLSTDAQLPLTRQIGWAALITADGAGEGAWKQAETNPSQLVDLILALSLVSDSGVRSTFYPKLQPLVNKGDSVEVQRAAITAVSAVPGHDAETFSQLATLIISGTEREAAVASMQRIPRRAWPREKAGALVESLEAYLGKVEVDKRTEPDAVAAFQLATDLVSLLPPEQAGPAGKTLRALGVSVYVIRTIPEQMLYDKTSIVVEAGKPVSMILINDDTMPHNLVVTAPAAVEEVGTAAEKMPPDADAAGRLYVPDSPKVLQATKLVEPGGQAKLSFTAPNEPGDYQYVCTFPGHWRRMVGALVVVKDVEAYLATHAASAAPKTTEWKVDDLLPDLAKIGSDRNLAGGKESFTKLACVTCHKMAEDGVSYGPELTGVFQRYQNNAAEVLRQIIEPSLVISNRYLALNSNSRMGRSSRPW